MLRRTRTLKKSSQRRKPTRLFETLERRELLAVIAMNFGANEQSGLPTAEYTSTSLGTTVTVWDHEGTSDWSGGTPSAGIPPTLTNNGAVISYYYDSNNTWRNGAVLQDSPLYGYLDDGGPSNQPFVQIGGLTQWLANAGDSHWYLSVLRSTDSASGFRELNIYTGPVDSSWYRDTLPTNTTTVDPIPGIVGTSGALTMETEVYVGNSDGFVLVDPNYGTSGYRGTIAAIIIESGPAPDPEPFGPGSIAINMQGRNPGYQLASASAAGVVPVTNWNNINNAGVDNTNTQVVSGTFGPFPLYDADGDQLAKLTWSATGTYGRTSIGGSDGDMMAGHIEATGTGATSVTVGDLADNYSSYDVYVYVGDDAGNRQGEIRFNGGEVQTFTSKIFDGTYTEGVDYFLYQEVTGDSFTVSVEPVGDLAANRTGIRGIEIVGTGEIPLLVTGVTPADGAELAAAPASVTLDFNTPVAAATVEAGDLTIDGTLSATGVTIEDEDTLQFTLPGGLGLGAHTLSIAAGALEGADEQAFDDFTSTFTIVGIPTVENLPAVDIQPLSATIGGSVTDTGGQTPRVFLYWGDEDGGTDPLLWNQVIDLDLQSGAFAYDLTGLEPETIYHYRAFAENIAGGVWAAESASFTTTTVLMPSVSLLPVDKITATSARFNGEVTDTGGEPPVVTFFYGTTDGGTDPLSWEHTLDLGARSGDFSAFAGDLLPENTYYVRARAENRAAAVWTDPLSLTTLAYVPPSVVINEIHYDPDISTELVEFVELYNATENPIDLSGWYFSDGIDYTFPDGVVFEADGYLVVAQDPAAVLEKYGVAALGPYDGKLSNEGEHLELSDAAGIVQDEVDYQLGFPWPTVGNAPGYSMELINPSLDNDLSGSWRSSAGIGGDVVDEFIASGSTWTYVKGTQEPSDPVDAWRQIGFDDDLWSTGTASIGYGDTHVVTELDDMRGNYTTVYFRKTFQVTDASAVTGLILEAQADDGINVWINGVHLLSDNVLSDEMTFEGTALAGVEYTDFRSFTLPDPSGYLVDGENVIAVQLLNASLSDSSDAWWDARLTEFSGRAAGPTPGALNSVYAANAPPQMRQVDHSPQQPIAGQDVTITVKATDPDGVASVILEYQLVDPGAYIRLTDAAYDTQWTSVPMTDDGTGGDEEIGDDVFSAVLPGTLQTDRRLVRYRITVTDTLGASVTGPYADDPQPNFAYFVYDRNPEWTGSLQPGVEPAVTYSQEVMNGLATYQLIAVEGDVINSQYNTSYKFEQFYGTFIYDGVVYDHIEFRNRGWASTYQVGKNKWKINFTRGHGFQARDNYGNKYDVTWDKLNILPGTNPWWRNDVSTEGTVLFEPVAYKLYELAGAPTPNTQFFQFRVIDGAEEASSTSQYEGDFWGLYIGIEQPDREFLDDRDLPDGNIFNMHGVAGASQRTQGSLLPSDKSDLSAFVSGYSAASQSLSWWEENLNFESYFAWSAINHAVNNSDVRPEENVNYYHNQETGQWYTIPWDLDLTFEDALHWNRPYSQLEQIQKVFSQHAEVNLAYENQVREYLDLLFDNGDAGLVVQEYANVLTGGQTTDTIVEANQALWDYHPRKVKQGIWYDNFTPALLPSQDFAGLITYMQTFLAPGGYGYDQLAAYSPETDIPDTPTITYTGPAGYPINRLTFQTSDFSDPQGAETFAALQWRIAEVSYPGTPGYDPSEPYIYEIEGTWQSDSLTTFDSEMTFSPLEVEAGKTYRVRVRMQDDTGRWSHWSDPIELTTSIALPTEVSRYLRVSELNYHPAGDADAEFIEFVNTSDGAEAATLDLTGTTITDGPSEPFVFPAGTMLAPGERILVVKDPAVFAAVYPEVDPAIVVGPFEGSLSNGGETIEVVDAEGGIVQQFDYNDSAEKGWPAEADGLGSSLEVVNTAGDYNQPTTWYASPQSGGSPGVAAAAAVLDRMIFYNNSALDTGGDAGDNAAIAPDKTALLPDQTAGLANYSSFERGLNGVMMDVANAVTLDLSDLLLLTGNDDDPTLWTAAAMPSIEIRPEAGRGGSDRVVLIWSDAEAVRNAWLQITVLAIPGHSDLLTSDVFYFGHFTGDVGDAASPGMVTAADLVAIRNHPRGPSNPAAIDDRYDINRDTLVNATDLILARNNVASPLDALRMITPSLPSAAPVDLSGDREGQPMLPLDEMDWLGGKETSTKRIGQDDAGCSLLIDLLLGGADS